MALETATYIDGLDADNPAASDAISTADDHLRLIKATLKATFPNIDGPVTVDQDDINGFAPLASPVLTGTPEAPTAAPGTNTTQLSTTAFVKAAIDAAVSATKEAMYPVGSIYTNAVDNTNPGTLLGFGTWTAFGAGRVPVGYDSGDSSFNSAEKTGGSKDAIVVSHTHTQAAHTHFAVAVQEVQASRYGYNLSSTGRIPISNPTNSDVQHSFGNATEPATVGLTSETTPTINSAGSSGTNANLQPYITVYMWKRTA